MRKPRKKTKSLLDQVRSPAFQAPMGGAGPHRDRKNEYRRQKRMDVKRDDPSERSDTSSPTAD